jgi:hypothetical protein
MNKPNKSLIAMRKAGLVVATSYLPEQKANADRYYNLVDAYCKRRAEATDDQLEASYDLGLRGIKIGQEDLFCNN